MKAIFEEKNILTQNRARPFQKGRFRHASRERNSIPFFLSGQKFPTTNLSERYQIKIKKIIFLRRLIDQLLEIKLRPNVGVFPVFQIVIVQVLMVGFV